jgi:hypothetical protein
MKLNNNLEHPSINLDKNWEEFENELLSVKREGVSELWNYIKGKTDHKTAPASTKFHLCCKGGLTEHSLNVLRFTRETQAIMRVPNISDDSVTLVSLLHDLCKTNYYVEGKVWDKEYKNKTNNWREISAWTVDDKLPLGHGEKSVIIASRFISLTPAEMAAIRWHMVGFDAGVHFYYPSGAPYKESMDKYPLLKLLVLGDMKAELYESYAYDN